MIEYPKMLYLLHDDNYMIVEDAKAETKARKSGFVDYAELGIVEPEPIIVEQVNVNNELPNATVVDGDVVTP